MTAARRKSRRRKPAASPRPRKPSLSYHGSIGIAAYLAKTNAEIDGVMIDCRHGHRVLTATELRAVLETVRERGFAVLPVCSYHDETGHCLGHAGMGSEGGEFRMPWYLLGRVRETVAVEGGV